eukprot:TRINITY_DN0_c4509_g1_i1.p1 TRINITY_DN0_c4509_g1~~TRINITY_DN0_c4509_g1_i1.p1  ORF type:complete len:124 (+),score=39.50 TRINITY_DN0_c4509_g1_i1:2-373(+)
MCIRDSHEKDSDREDSDEEETKAESQEADETYEFLMSDRSKVETLRLLLEERFGLEPLKKIYKVLRDEYDKTGDVDKIAEKFSKWDYYRPIIPNIDRQLIEKNIPLVFTLILLEERDQPLKAA